MRSTKSPSWTERLLGLDPLPGPPHVFALERYRLAYARLNREEERFALADLRTVDLPPEVFANGTLGGPVRQPELFAQHLGALLDEQPALQLTDAALILPDAWLRVAFTEVGDLPSGPGRQDVLRWKLKRLVPFRVEELRLEGIEVASLPGQEEPRRMLLAFGVEQLLTQLEGLFAARQIRLGYLSNRTLTLLSGLADALEPRPLAALVVADADGYTAAFARRGEPVLYRHKQLDGGRLDNPTVHRDLTLTRAFLLEHFPDQKLDVAMLLADPELEAAWKDLLEGGLETPVELVRDDVLPLLASAGTPWTLVAPMIGAVSQEVV